jgi:hypothetical protein
LPSVSFFLQYHARKISNVPAANRQYTTATATWAIRLALLTSKAPTGCSSASGPIHSLGNGLKLSFLPIGDFPRTGLGSRLHSYSSIELKRSAKDMMDDGRAVATKEEKYK